MLQKLSVNAILKLVIATLGAVVVFMLAAGAWSSWNRLQVDTRIAGVAATSAYAFTAMHNLRSDRSRSVRLVQSDEVITARDPRIFESRDAEMPALHGALATLPTVAFAEQQALTAELAQRVKKLSALHEESVAALRQPKAARRAGLAVRVVRDPRLGFAVDTVDDLQALAAHAPEMLAGDTVRP